MSDLIPVEPGILKKWNKTENRFIYYLDLYDETGTRKRESTTSASLTFARELLISRKEEIAKRKKLPDRYMPKIKLSDFVDAEYLPIHGKTLKSYSDLKGVCEKLKVMFGDNYLHEITRHSVEKYKAKRMTEVAGNTINNELNTLSGIYTKAIEWGKALFNPVNRVKRFRINERRRILERWEQDVLIIAAGQEKKAPHLQTLIIFDLSTGLRKEELLSIEWTDFDSENKTLQVRADIAKYHKTRHVDLNRHAQDVLVSLQRRGKFIFCNDRGERLKNFKHSFSSAVKRAGLKDVVIHDLRRTFGSNCVMSGVSLATVQAWMGHSSIETTIKHYAHLVKSFRKEEIRKIEGRMDTCMDTLLKTTLRKSRKSLKNLVPPRGIEPLAPGLGSQNNKKGRYLEYKGFNAKLMILKALKPFCIFCPLPYFLSIQPDSVTI
jgi:integrase